jgi:hypothetical protein
LHEAIELRGHSQEAVEDLAKYAGMPDHVADHAFRLIAEHIERASFIGVVGGPLQGQQPDVRPVATSG